jgi:hypothetical protein
MELGEPQADLRLTCARVGHLLPAKPSDMPVTVSALRQASRRASQPVAKTLTEARARRLKTVFLCHSHRDSELVEGLVTLLQEAGWSAYVDWADAQMPEKPNRTTAARLQEKIGELDYFLFLATANSMSSRWCPWEIGYANGKMSIDRIIVCATTDGTITNGTEYLDLYRRLDFSTANRLAVWQPGHHSDGTLVREL